jgi:hypothetical protein
MKQLTKIERKAIHKAFKGAVKFLHTGRENSPGSEEYICYSLDQAGFMQTVSNCDRSYWETMQLVEDAKNIIQDRLGDDCISVESWLKREACIPVEELTFENIQAYRHRWLKSLIKEFSK